MTCWPVGNTYSVCVWCGVRACVRAFACVLGVNNESNILSNATSKYGASAMSESQEVQFLEKGKNVYRL